MIAEVVIHLGQQWRDLAYCMFGMVLGVGMGIICTADYMERKARKK